MSISVDDTRGISICRRWFGVLALGLALGVSLFRPAAADDAKALARALVERPFDQTVIQKGYRLIEVITDEVMPPEATEAGVVAGAAATFQGPRELFRDAVAFYLIFGAAEDAAEYYETQFPKLINEKGGNSVVARATLEISDRLDLPTPCLLSPTEDVISCMYLEYELATVIQIVAGPGPTYDANIDKDQLENEFILGDGPVMIAGILPAALSHLLRAGGDD